MAILNEEAAIEFAKDFTMISIEKNLITAADNASQSANNVYEFYKTLYEKFSGDTVE